MIVVSLAFVVPFNSKRLSVTFVFVVDIVVVEHYQLSQLLNFEKQ